MYTLELLEDKSFYTQSIESFKKHGCKGKVLFVSYLHILNQIIKENEQ